MPTRKTITPDRFSHALAAVALLFAFIEIRAGKLVTIVAARLGCILRIDGVTAQKIFAAGHGFQMRIANAGASATQVIGLKSWRKWLSGFHLIRKSRCPDGFRMTQSELPVSLFGDLSSPEPAVPQIRPVRRNRSVLVDVTPEARCDRTGSHGFPIARTGTEFLFGLRVWFKGTAAVQASGVHAHSVLQGVH